ncbi:glycosyltransferase [Chamaesiphon polymorphus]|uniref:Glycosyl transferase family 2 n=1 Tax=Chamaesiphon polymorphus CCALA 037 TaxID=2107692 RepID=A0A2T1FWQ5_9CYAN|nr:glycosyltransferase [Chamaesiphon polymorphus]PSB49411.1 glycosyl transferase family 2 [Chamaesiphon polymorphus CCALA 037]
MDTPFISVIIPVFNDVHRLKLCLQALENQTYPKDCYEVIVVDNGSDPNESIDQLVTQFDRAIAAFESKPGSYAARNKGISIAKGDVIAFTDADCIPAPNWIEKGLECLRQTRNCGLVAGRIDVFFQNDQEVTPVELYESITAFPQKQLLESRHFGATANLFTFRHIFENVGNFNSNLKSGGDVEWGQRVFAHGYEQAYAEAARVHHPARRSFKELYKRTIRLVGGDYDLQRQKESSLLKQNVLFIQKFALDLIPPLMFIFNAILDSRLQGFKQKLDVSLVMCFVRYISAWERLKLKAGAISARE